MRVHTLLYSSQAKQFQGILPPRPKLRNVANKTFLTSILASSYDISSKSNLNMSRWAKTMRTGEGGRSTWGRWWVYPRKKSVGSVILVQHAHGSDHFAIWGLSIDLKKVRWFGPPFRLLARLMGRVSTSLHFTTKCGHKWRLRHHADWWSPENEIISPTKHFEHSNS